MEAGFVQLPALAVTEIAKIYWRHNGPDHPRPKVTSGRVTVKVGSIQGQKGPHII
jgi:hypothetical protein